MATHRNITRNLAGDILHEEIVEIPDLPPTLEDLTAEIAHLRDTLDAVSKSGTFDAARTAIAAKLEETKGAGETIEVEGIGG